MMQPEVFLWVAVATLVVVANSFVLPLPSGTTRPSSPPPPKRFSSQLSFSDVPREKNSSSPKDKKRKVKKDFSWKSLLPPPPEDQFIMTGDLAVLFFYAFTSHYLNNYLVESVLESSDSIREAVHTLDPMEQVVTLHQSPVWVNPAQTEMMDRVLSLNVQHSLLDHWGPLFSTAGTAAVASCSCWLLAGWFHRAFSFRNTLDCDATKALQTTFKTWISMAVLMCLLTLGSNELVGHYAPFLQAWLGCDSCNDYLLTKADTMFLVDSASVLIAWRFMANTVVNTMYR